MPADDTAISRFPRFTGFSSITITSYKKTCTQPVLLHAVASDNFSGVEREFWSAFRIGCNAAKKFFLQLFPIRIQPVSQQ